MNYKDLERQIWSYLEVGQYENPIDSETLLDELCQMVSEAVHEKSITEEELYKLSEIYDTGVEWEE